MIASVLSRLHDRRDAASDLGEDAGFTLIELMVVLLILAILLAIAIPTFLGVTGGANDRSAQSNLNTALTTAKAAESQNTNQVYTGITAASLHTNEPSITFQAGAVAAAGQVSVYVSSDGNGIVLASWSPAASGTCWYVSDNTALVTDATGPYTAAASVPPALTAGTTYGRAPLGTTKANCNATAAIPALSTWGTNFSAV